MLLCNHTAAALPEKMAVAVWERRHAGVVLSSSPWLLWQDPTRRPQSCCTTRCRRAAAASHGCSRSWTSRTRRGRSTSRRRPGRPSTVSATSLACAPLWVLLAHCLSPCLRFKLGCGPSAPRCWHVRLHVACCPSLCLCLAAGSVYTMVGLHLFVCGTQHRHQPRSVTPHQTKTVL